MPNGYCKNCQWEGDLEALESFYGELICPCCGNEELIKDGEDEE